MLQICSGGSGFQPPGMWDFGPNDGRRPALLTTQRLKPRKADCVYAALACQMQGDTQWLPPPSLSLQIQFPLGQPTIQPASPL